MKKHITKSLYLLLAVLCTSFSLNSNAQSCTTSNGNVGMAGQAMDGSTLPFRQAPTCPPGGDSAASNRRGFMTGCATSQASCNVNTTPTQPLPPAVVMDPCLTSITYEEVVNEPQFHLQYWNDCLTSISNLDNNYSAPSQGFVNQLFCATDTNGFPAATTSIGTPISGIVDQYPSNQNQLFTEINDIDTNNGTTIAGACDASSLDTNTELSQTDFWIIVPEFVNEIGFKASGGGADATLLMIGDDLPSMCSTVEYLQINGTGTKFEGISEAYYTVPSGTTPICGGNLKILRARSYISDISDKFGITLLMDVGLGFQSLTDDSPYATIIPATGPQDNVKPTDADIETETKVGFLDINGNIFDSNGNYVPNVCSYTPNDVDNPCLEAENDINQTPQGTPVGGNVLTNDDNNAQGEMTVTSAMIDTDGDGIPDTNLPIGSTETIAGVGTIKLNSDGSYTFTPCAGAGDPDSSCSEPFTGPVPTIAYTAEDESGTSVTATLDIDVIPVDDPATNEPPLANDDTNSTDQGVAVGDNLLDNDSDPDTPNSDLSVTEISFPDGMGGTTTVQVPDGGNTGTETIPSVGTIIVASDGTYTFTPCAGPGDPVPECTMAFTGETPPIGYTIEDPEGNKDDATLVIDVAPDPNGDINNTYSNDDSSVGAQGVEQSTNVLANDHDPEGDTQTLTGATVEGPTPGEQVPVSTNPLMPTKVYKDGVEVGTSYIDPATGMIYFDPKPDFVGTVPITYTTEDGNGASDTATYYPSVVATGTVSGTVENTNGQGIGGVTIELKDAAGNVVLDVNGDPLTTTTNPDGTYEFTGVPPGDYFIVETDPEGYDSVSDGDDTNDGSDDMDMNTDTNNNSIPVSVTGGETDTDNNFVNVLPAEVGGQVTNDQGEGIEGVTIQIVDANGNVVTGTDGQPLTVTTSDGTTDVDGDGLPDPAGSYYFDNVPPGDYFIKQTNLSNYNSVSDGDGTQDSANDTDANTNTTDDLIPISVVEGEKDTGNNFVDALPASISGVVENTEGDALSGVTVELLDENGVVIATVMTANGVSDDFDGDSVPDPAGSYYFGDLLPGTYTVKETDPTNYTSISDGDDFMDGSDDTDMNMDSNNNEISVTLVGGENDTENNFVDAIPAIVGGQLTNDQGQGVTGSVIKIVDSNGNVVIGTDGQPLTAMTSNGTTDVDGDGMIDPPGSYYFDNVPPGDYNIVQTDLSGYISISDGDEVNDGGNDTDMNTNTNDNSISISVISGEEDLGNNFEDAQPAAVSGSVTQQSTGNGIVGVTIQIQNAAGEVIATTTTSDGNTDVNGDNVSDPAGSYYIGNLPPGDYVIVEIDPADYSSISDTDNDTIGSNDNDMNADGNDNKIPVSLIGGELDVANDFVDELNVLPITLGEFAAKAVNMDAQLTWITLSESNNSHFIIEVSTTGLSNDFVSVGQVSTKADNGNSQSEIPYEYTDKYAINRGEQLYYRLKQVDVDGTEAFTEIRVVLFENIFLTNMVYPNPVKQGQDVVIQGSNIKQYKVFNSDGLLVNEVEYNDALQATSFSTANLSSGLYFVVINNSDVRKIIVQ